MLELIASLLLLVCMCGVGVGVGGYNVRRGVVSAITANTKRSPFFFFSRFLMAAVSKPVSWVYGGSSCPRTGRLLLLADADRMLFLH